MTNRRLQWAALVAVATLVAAAPSARAQFGMGNGPQKDIPVDAATRAQVLDSLAARVEEIYVFPEKGREIARAILQRKKRGDYERIGSSRELADSLTALLQLTSHDRHLRMAFRNQPFPRAGIGEHAQGPEKQAGDDQARIHNYGFEKLQRLPGNVGYVELRNFIPGDEAIRTAAAAMGFLSNTDAIIFDLRKNGGGSPDMIAFLLTYLVPEGDRVNFNNFYQRQSNSTEQYWTLPSVPGRRYLDREVYVLTSRFTFSAAEEFAYDIQTQKLGTLVGETTGGGANPGGMARLADHFAAFIPSGRAVNPVTGTNWEGVGVKPEVEAPAPDALKVAYKRALQHLSDKSADPEWKDLLQMAIADADKLPSDPMPAPPR